MSIYHEKEELWNYLIFGGLAFIVNYVAYAICVQIFSLHHQVGNIISWVVAVIFVYWTNRNFVFKSEVTDKKGVIREVITFLGARIATLVLEIIVLWLMVDIMSMNDMIAKLIGQFIVIVTNYGFSKLVIFRKKPE